MASSESTQLGRATQTPGSLPHATPAQRLGTAVRTGANLVCGCLFAAVFFVFCFKIIRRYTGGDAAWADELTVILFIWILFLANGLIVSDSQQITFDLIHRSLRGRTRKVVEILRATLVLGILLFAAPGALDYIRFLYRERTAVLDWRLDFVYACFGIFLVATIARLAYQVVGLLRPMAGESRES